MTRPNSAIAAVRTLLEQQKQALLSGDLAALALLPDRFEQAMRQLADDRPKPEAMTDLAQAAARNARQRGLSGLHILTFLETQHDPHTRTGAGAGGCGVYS